MSTKPGELQFFSVPGFLPHLNWRFSTTPQRELNGRRGFQPRGRCLGGSSAINASMYVRGHPSDYDEWAELGCEGWSYDEVLPYFVRSENNAEMGGNGFHGAEGPLHVRNQASPHPVSQAFLQAAAELQIPLSSDVNGERQEGAVQHQVTQFHSGPRKGERCSASAAYLLPVLDRPNLTVVTGAHVTKIEVEQGRAKGVSFTRAGKAQSVKTQREIILCAGALQSPQLLMLSGIGPSEELTDHGIPVESDLPGVGKNLQDHLDIIVQVRSPDRTLPGLNLASLIKFPGEFLKWKREGAGLLTTPIAEGTAFVRSSPSLDRPDLQLVFLSAMSVDHGRKATTGFGYSLHCCVLRPHSRGEIRLESADPKAAPVIEMGYLSDRRDLDLMVKGARLIRRVLEGKAFDPYRGKELFSSGVKTDAEWEAYIRQYTDTVYHPVGTCKMGVDKMAVVDPRLRVKGIEGLRVADASVMPTLIGGNTNAPSIMIGEKACDLIKEDRAA